MSKKIYVDNNALSYFLNKLKNVFSTKNELDAVIESIPAIVEEQVNETILNASW